MVDFSAVTKPIERLLATAQNGLEVLRYGGLETDIATYARIWIEMSRGDMSAGWCMCLMANHALQVGSWFPQQAEIGRASCRERVSECV